MSTVDRYGAVVLAGGRGRRLGLDKAAVDVGGSASLDLVLDAVAGADEVVVVGPERPVRCRPRPPVRWCREDPPYAGPVAALRAGLALVRAQVVAVLACDVPLVDRAEVARLVGAVRGHDAAWLVDAAGRDQYLVAAYRQDAIADRAQSPRPARSLRELVTGLDVVRLPDERGLSDDVDTPEDLARVRGRKG